MQRIERLGLEGALARGRVSEAELRTLTGSLEDLRRLTQLHSEAAGGVDTYRELLELGGMEGISKPTSAELWDSASGGDYVVIAPSTLEAQLLPLLRHRVQGGHRPVLLDPEVIEAATGGRGIAAISETLSKAARSWETKPRFVLLVGDPTAVPCARAVPLEERERLGHGLVGPRFASDHRFSDLDGDHRPELAVGRLPVRSPAELEGVVDKLISYDVHPSGEWQLEATMVDGDPAWGELTNKIVDLYAKNRFAHSASAATRIERISFNPTRAIGDEHLRLGRSLEQGRLLVSYFGHGTTSAVDGLGDWDVPRIRSRNGYPIILINACLAGEFGTGTQSLAAALVNDLGGAAAAVAASDITLPHTNADWGEVLAFEVLRGAQPTMGQAFLEAKLRYDERETARLPRLVRRLGDRMVEGQIGHDTPHSHLYLYNLLGDPATPVRRALPLDVDLRGSTQPGETLHVRLGLPSSDQVRAGLAQLERGDGKRLGQPSTLRAEAGVVQGTLDIPAGLRPGRYFVRIEVQGELEVYSARRPIDVSEPFPMGS